jgi:hypothetical protein
MAKPDTSIYLASAAFNGKTYDTTLGGPQGINAEIGGTNVPFFSGNAHWPVFNAIVENQAGITIELSEFAEDIPIGTKGPLVVTIEKPGGTQAVITYANMIFAGSTAGQTFGRYSTRVLRFVYEAATGTTAPV